VKALLAVVISVVLFALAASGLAAAAAGIVAGFLGGVR
jgi:hypothetical protein